MIQIHAYISDLDDIWYHVDLIQVDGKLFWRKISSIIKIPMFDDAHIIGDKRQAQKISTKVEANWTYDVPYNILCEVFDYYDHDL